MEENQKKQGPGFCLRCRSWVGDLRYGGMRQCTRLGLDVGPAFGCVSFEALVQPVPLPPLTVRLLAVVLRELVHELTSTEPLPAKLLHGDSPINAKEATDA